MAKVTPRTLSGFMELLPADQMKMERMMAVLRNTYSKYGFTPLDTPVIESAEVLLAKGGGETEGFRTELGHRAADDLRCPQQRRAFLTQC